MLTATEKTDLRETAYAALDGGIFGEWRADEGTPEEVDFLNGCRADWLDKRGIDSMERYLTYLGGVC